MNNIECNFVAENLSAFIDQELDTKASFRVKKHLCECLKCRREFSKLLKLQRVMKKYFEKSCQNTFVANCDVIHDVEMTL